MGRGKKQSARRHLSLVPALPPAPPAQPTVDADWDDWVDDMLEAIDETVAFGLEDEPRPGLYVIEGDA